MCYNNILFCRVTYSLLTTAEVMDTYLPRGFRTHRASTRHCGMWCGTTWSGPERQRIWLCNLLNSALRCPERHSLIYMQLHSSAASCCLHLHTHNQEPALSVLYAFKLAFTFTTGKKTCYVLCMNCQGICN